MGKRVIADEKEVLKILSGLARGREDMKPSEQLKAAELLGRHYRLFGGVTAAAEGGKEGEIRVFVDYGE